MIRMLFYSKREKKIRKQLQIIKGKKNRILRKDVYKQKQTSFKENVKYKGGTYLQVRKSVTLFSDIVKQNYYYLKEIRN